MENSGIEIDYPVLQRPQFFIFGLLKQFLIPLQQNQLVSNCLHLLIYVLLH